MFFDQFKILCNREGTTPTAFTKNILKISSSKVTAWKNGSIPKYDILEKIAKYFNVTVGYLFDGENSSIQQHITNLHGNAIAGNGTTNINNSEIQKLDEMEKELIKRFRELSFDEKLKVFDALKK